MNTKPEVANLWRVYSAVKNWYQQNGMPFTPDVTLAFAFHGSWRNFGNVRGARNMQLTNLRNSMPSGRFTMDILDCDDLLEGAIHSGISIRRDINNVGAIPLPGPSEASGYVCVIPGASIVSAFSRPGLDENGAMVSKLDDHFFLDNPRHYLGEAARFNRGATALAANLRRGHQGRVIACHNGIVVVARDVDYDPQARRLTLVTPQIVNGCQSTYTMQACRDVLDGANVVVKVVRTDSEDLKDAVILGSNTQEEVDEYDLLSRHRFVRELEREFERHAENRAENRLWLERRWWERTLWREEDPNFRVPSNQILTPRQLMDGFAASILGRPDLAHGNPQQLLRMTSRGEIFSPLHEPTLYRAIGWLVVATRSWAHDVDEDWKDLPTERGGYGSRHQYIHALWRLAEASPDKTASEDIAKGRPAQVRFEDLIGKLSDQSRRRSLTLNAADAVQRADAEARRQGRDMRNRQARQWFTELVGQEADKLKNARPKIGA